MTVERIHSHEAGAKEMLVIEHRVERCHYGIHRASVAEHLHLARGVECLLYLSARCPGLHHIAIPVGILHSIADEMIETNLGKLCPIRCIRRTFRASLLAEESTLQVATDMFGNSLLGILLHAGVNGGIDLQTVGINVILRTVGFGIFFNPTIEGIGLPCYGVIDKLLRLPPAIISSLRPFGLEHATQLLAEVGSDAILDIHAMEIESER